MPPRSRRARWRRTWRSGALRILVPTLVVAIVAAFVVGALSQVNRGSGPYRRTVDRGFAALASTAALRSDATGQMLETIVSGGPSLGRVSFFATLGSVASQSTSEAGDLESSASPMPADDAGARCLSALAARASASSTISSVLEGLVGGATGQTFVSPDQTLAALQSAATTLAGADADWAGCRRALRRSPGTPTLGASRWITKPALWSDAALAQLVYDVATSRSLLAVHALAITAVSIDPAPLPSPGAALVPVTNTLVVHVTVADQGNVDEPAVQVRATLLGGPASPAPQSAIVAIGAGRAMAVVLGPFTVTPGTGYTLQLTAAPPSGAGAATSTQALQVASVPTTTTTIAPPTTTTPEARSGSSAGGG